MAPPPLQSTRLAHRAAGRIRLSRTVRVAGWGLVAGGALAFFAAVLGKAIPLDGNVTIALAGASALVALLAGVAVGLGRRVTDTEGAGRLDETLRLHDRLTTAVELGGLETRSAFGELALADAERRATGVSPARLIPIALERRVWAGGLLCLAASATVIGFVPARRIEPVPAFASSTPEERIAAAERIAEIADSIDEPVPVSETEPARGEPQTTRADELATELDEIQQRLERGELDAGDALATAAERLEQAAAESESRAADASETERALADAASRLADQTGAQIGEETADLAESLAKGDLDRASEAARRLTERSRGMPPEARERIAEDLDALAEALDRTEAEPAPQQPAGGADESLREQLRERVGDLTDEEAVSDALQQEGLDPEAASDLADRLARDERDRLRAERTKEDLRRLKEAVERTADEVREPDERPGTEPGTEPEHGDSPQSDSPPGGQPGTEQTETEQTETEQSKKEQTGSKPAERTGPEPSRDEPAGGRPPGASDPTRQSPSSERGEPKPGSAPSAEQGTEQGAEQGKKQEGAHEHSERGVREEADKPDGQGKEPKPGTGEQPQQEPGEQTEQQPGEQSGKRRGDQPEQGTEPSRGEPDGERQGTPPGSGEPGSQQPTPGTESTGEPSSGEPSQSEPAPGEPSGLPGQPTPGDSDQGTPAPGRESGPDGGSKRPGEPGSGGPGSGGPGSGEPDPDRPGSLEDELGRLAEGQRQRRNDEQRAAELRRKAQELLDDATPEERERLNEMAERLAEQNQLPQQGPTQPWDAAERTVDARDPNATPGENEQVLAEWYNPEGEPAGGVEGAGQGGTSARRLRDAAESAERAVEQQRVPPRYRRLVRDVFRRLQERAAEREGAAPLAEQIEKKDGGTKKDEGSGGGGDD